MDELHGYMDGSDRNDYRRNDHRRDRGGRRRDRKPRDRMRRDRAESQENLSSDIGEMGDGSQVKTPVILAKKGLANDTQKKDSPAILSIQRRDGVDTPASNTSTHSNRSYASETSGYHRHSGNTSRHEKTAAELVSPAPTTHLQQASHVDHHIPTGLAALDIRSDMYPNEAMSLVDGNFMWNEKPFECLMDQTDFVVIGCVGMQSVGKSMLMSMIAGQNIDVTEKMRYVFRPQKKSDMEKCLHRTIGIDMYITKERMILLDTQPLMSPSMLDQYLRYDRKVPSEYSTAEICLEVQALQILTFLYTVCNVVIVVQDHFNDVVLMNLLKTAEMLKPSTVSNNQDGGPSNKPEEFREFFPYLVFAYTCCDERAYEVGVVHAMCDVIWKMFCNSRLRVRSSASMVRSPVFPYHHEERFFNHHDVNLFFLPSLHSSSGTDPLVNSISRYHGHPSLQVLMKVLRQQLASVSREPLTHHILTEKNWFHYAARTWEAVKKSKLIAEYHRLLSS